MRTVKDIEIIGMPMDLGADRRGVDMGPSAIRIAGLARGLCALGYTVTDAGNVMIEAPETRNPGPTQTKYLEEITQASEALAQKVLAAKTAGRFPLMLGGDHAAAIGSIAGVSQYYRTEKKPFGLLWLDAHGDMNRPETSPTGNIHGMPLAVAVGHGAKELTHLLGFSPKVEANRVALVGIRNIDEQEKEEIRESGVHAFTMRDFDERGVRAVMEEALAVVTQDDSEFHVSLDIDMVDPRIAPGVGTDVLGGTTFRESHLIMEMISDAGLMRSLDLVEVNPILDNHNQTAQLGVDLVLSALGQKIL